MNSWWRCHAFAQSYSLSMEATRLRLLVSSFVIFWWTKHICLFHASAKTTKMFTFTFWHFHCTEPRNNQLYTLKIRQHMIVINGSLFEHRMKKKLIIELWTCLKNTQWMIWNILKCGMSSSSYLSRYNYQILRSLSKKWQRSTLQAWSTRKSQYSHKVVSNVTRRIREGICKTRELEELWNWSCREFVKNAVYRKWIHRKREIYLLWYNTIQYNTIITFIVVMFLQ